MKCSADFSTAIGAPEKDLQATRPNETDSAKVTGLLRSFAKDENAVFASMVHNSKQVNIYRRKKQKHGDKVEQGGNRKNEGDDLDIFDDEEEETATEQELSAMKLDNSIKKVKTRFHDSSTSDASRFKEESMVVETKRS